MASPRLNAFWRIAPGVRFIAFEILTTGVLLFECAFRSRTCSFVQATRIVRLAIKFILFERLSLSTSQRHDKHFKAQSCLAPQQTTRHGHPLPGSITCHSANCSVPYDESVELQSSTPVPLYHGFHSRYSFKSNLATELS